MNHTSLPNPRKVRSYYNFKEASPSDGEDELNLEPKFSLGRKSWPLRPGKFYFLKSHSEGFTLVELIIVMVSMVLIFSIGYANYRGFQRRQHMESAVRLVMGDLRLAQGMALSGRKPAEPAGNDCETGVLGGYVFSRTTASSYSIYAICPNWGNRVLVRGPVDLPEDINLLAFGGGNRFAFQVLGRGTDRSANITLRFNFVGGGVPNRTIIITPEGNIQ